MSTNTLQKNSMHHPAFWVIALIALMCVIYMILSSAQTASQPVQPQVENKQGETRPYEKRRPVQFEQYKANPAPHSHE